MVMKHGGYFGPPFKGYHGVTQGDPLSSTVFNRVVESIVRNLEMVAAPKKSRAEGLGEMIQELKGFSYADDELVSSPQRERLQRSFNFLIYIFDRFSLRNNVQTIISMAFRL